MVAAPRAVRLGRLRARDGQLALVGLEAEEEVPWRRTTRQPAARTGG